MNMKIRFNTYRAAERRWGAFWNDYDYRPYGGERYRIGAAVVVAGCVFSLCWAKPGTNFGHYT